MRFYLDFLYRDCILCPITNVLQKRRKKNDFFGLLVLLLLSTLGINHFSQNNIHHRFMKLIDNFRIRDTL